LVGDIGNNRGAESVVGLKRGDTTPQPLPRISAVILVQESAVIGFPSHMMAGNLSGPVI